MPSLRASSDTTLWEEYLQRCRFFLMTGMVMFSITLTKQHFIWKLDSTCSNWSRYVLAFDTLFSMFVRPRDRKIFEKGSRICSRNPILCANVLLAPIRWVDGTTWWVQQPGETTNAVVDLTDELGMSARSVQRAFYNGYCVNAWCPDSPCGWIMFIYSHCTRHISMSYLPYIHDDTTDVWRVSPDFHACLFLPTNQIWRLGDAAYAASEHVQ